MFLLPFRGLKIFVTLILFVGVAFLASYNGPTNAAELPAGTCSESTGTWVCNVQDRQLFFDKAVVGGQELTQASNSTQFNPAAGTSLTYRNVFVEGSTIIDAVLYVNSKTGNIRYIDEDSTYGGWSTKSIVTTFNGGGSETEFTVSFFERSSGEAVIMKNVTVMVYDLDGETRGEFATFQGLSNYTTTLASNTNVRVKTDLLAPVRSDSNTFSLPGSENPNPETGVRQFFSVADDDTGIASNNAVAVSFDSVSSVGFLAGGRGSVAGAIGFDFKASATFFQNSSTIATKDVVAASYTLTYNADGGVGTVPNAVTGAGSQILSLGSGLSKNSVPISAWSSLPNGGGAVYPLGASYLPVKDTTLYAVYETNTVTFKANGGTGADYTQTGSGPTALSERTFTRSGYSFAGWNTAENGSGAVYADKATYGFASDTVLYAQWTLALPAQSVTWSLSDTTSSQSPFTPAGAASDGSGTITYSVVDPGATGCTVNSTTGQITYTGSGTCVVRATAAATSSNDSGFTDVSFQLTTATTQTPQTVTWNPSETTSSSSPFTPDGATSDGSGSISYSVANPGVTGCIVNTTTGEISYTASGTCVVRATAAATSSHGSGYTDVSFQLTATSFAGTSEGLVRTGLNVSTIFAVSVASIMLGLGLRAKRRINV